jgi:hypothetical protein
MQRLMEVSLLCPPLNEEHAEAVLIGLAERREVVCLNHRFLLSFPYVCPEPVLINHRSPKKSEGKRRAAPAMQPPVIHFFTPVTLQLPSSCIVALVWIAFTSEPAYGSEIARAKRLSPVHRRKIETFLVADLSLEYCVSTTSRIVMR